MELVSILTIIVVLAFIGGGGFLLYTGLNTNRKPQNSINNWPTTTAKVLSSEVVESSGFDEKGNPVAEFKPVIRFSYVVSGKEYTSIQIGPAARLENVDSARHMADQYHSGSSIMVHYDPDKPTETLLAPRPQVVRSVIIAGGILILIGILTACGGFAAFLFYFFTH